MYLAQQNQIGKTRNYINTFGGYNHQERISDAEFYEMRNMTSDYYPVLAAREPRNYKLKIASSEYEMVACNMERKFVQESLTMRYAVYTLTFEVVENGTYEFEYTVDESYVSKSECEVYLKNDERKSKIAAERKFTVPEGYKEAEITITATWNHEEEKWKEENLALFVHDINVRKSNETIRGMLLKNGKLAYLINHTLYWNGHRFDFAECEETGDQQLISYGAYILIFPMGVYVNTNDVTDYGYLGVKAATDKKVKYTMCSISGAEYDYQPAANAPENPKDGQYWLKTSAEGDALYQWSETMAMWIAVATTYIKILVEDPHCFDVFEVQDTIFVEGAKVEALNGSNTILEKGNDGEKSYIIVTGIMDKSTEQTGGIKFERKIPKLAHVCVAGNRVWGCYYGTSEEGILNEIYACKLGDPKNWYSYDGVSTDAYAISLGDDGEFTGAYTYQGYPLFFKENNIYKIYGSYPAAYQLVTYDCRGAQKGSSRAIAIVDEYLVYKSINDICVFDGNYPTSLSKNLGKRTFRNGAAGSYMSKYYISMQDEQGDYAVYAYDFKTNLWIRDEEMEIIEFISTKSGELYGRNKVGIVSFGNENNDLGLEQLSGAKEKVEWFAETGTYGMDSPDRKVVTNIKIRAAIPFEGRLKLEVYYDDAGRWNEYWLDQGGVNGDGKIRTYEIPILPVNCDTMRIRLSGVGSVRIYSIAKKIEEGGR